MRCTCLSWFRPPICGISFPWPPSCRWPASASPFRTSRRSSATWMRWTRWRAASARSTRSGAKPESGAAPTRTRPASPARWRACCDCAKSSVLIVGNGGAARGAAFALADAGAKITLVGRNPDRVRVAGQGLRRRSHRRASSSTARHFDAVVHATPLGMFPHVDGCFFDGEIPADVVFDMVYNPAGDPAHPQRPRTGQEVHAGPRDVHRTGRAPVRDLDRRDGAPRRPC